MNTAYLKYVVEVGRVQSITKAAQNLYMGQPNLSKAIKELEREIGITIFRRTPKGVIPTPKGKEFLGYAEGILSQLNELESLYKPHEGNALELHIVVPRAAYAAAVFADFLNQQQNIEHLDIHFRETGANNAVHLVADGEADFGIIRYQVSQSSYFENLLEQSGLQSEVLGEFRLQLMLSENHPLADHTTIEYHELAGYPELVHGDYQMPSLSFHKIRRGAELDSARKQITVYDRGSQYDLLNYIPGSYLWSSPVPHDILERNRLVLRPCSLSDVANMDVLIYPQDVPPPPHAAELVALFREAARKWQKIEE
jgi:DNA-binding transcriptional LysR family regulator